MGNPLIDLPGIADIIIPIGRDILEGQTCGIFPKVGPGQTCQGISFGQGCCAGLVTGPGDIGGGDATCPPGTRRVNSPVGGGSICVSLEDPTGGNGGVGPPIEGQVVNGKLCCPSGHHQKANTSICIKNRKTNFGNIGAAKRAVRRLSGAQRALRSIEALVDKTVKPRKATRRAPRARSRCACPKGACSC